MRPLDLQRNHSDSDENLADHSLELQEQRSPTVNGHLNDSNGHNSVGMDYPRVSTAARVTPDTQHSR